MGDLASTNKVGIDVALKSELMRKTETDRVRNHGILCQDMI